MKVTNSVMNTATPTVGQWNQTATLLVITDDVGAEWIVGPAEGGGLEIRPMVGCLAVYPRACGLVDVKVRL
jgi:hypothetical protein